MLLLLLIDAFSAILSAITAPDTHCRHALCHYYGLRFDYATLSPPCRCRLPSYATPRQLIMIRCYDDAFDAATDTPPFSLAPYAHAPYAVFMILLITMLPYC